MKKLALVAGALLAVAGVARAQHVEALIESEEYWNFSIRPEFKVTSLGGDLAQLLGVQLGPSLGNRLYLGIAGYGLVSSVDGGSAFEDLGAFDLWYLGGAGDYTVLHHRMLHGSFGLFIGYGQLSLSQSVLVTTTTTATDSETGETTTTTSAESQSVAESADLFVTEPNANLLVNVTDEGLELGLGLGYRFVNGSDFSGLEDSDLSGPVGTLFLRWTEQP